MVLQEIEFITSLGCPVTSYPNLLALVAGSRFDPKRLVSRTVTLDDTNDVLRQMSDYATTGLTVITAW